MVRHVALTTALLCIAALAIRDNEDTGAVISDLVEQMGNASYTTNSTTTLCSGLSRLQVLFEEDGMSKANAEKAVKGEYSKEFMQVELKVNDKDRQKNPDKPAFEDRMPFLWTGFDTRVEGVYEDLMQWVDEELDGYTVGQSRLYDLLADDGVKLLADTTCKWPLPLPLWQVMSRSYVQMFAGERRAAVGVILNKKTEWFPSTDEEPKPGMLESSVFWQQEMPMMVQELLVAQHTTKTGFQGQPFWQPELQIYNMEPSVDCETLMEGIRSHFKLHKDLVPFMTCRSCAGYDPTSETNKKMLKDVKCTSGG